MTRRHVEVCYPAERDVPGWSARHAKGEVPGRWPYGLDEIGNSGAQVSMASLGPPNRLQNALSRLPARPRAWFTPGNADTSLAWDENIAVRMVALRPRRHMYSGAIWVTDRLQSGSASYLAKIRSVLRQMEGVFVISKAQIEPLREFLGGDGPTVEYFRFGIDTDYWHAQPYPRSPLVLSVGGDRDRDAVTLFAALAKVRAERPDAQIVVQSSSHLEPPSGVTKVDHFSHAQLREIYGRATVVTIATAANLHASGMTVSLEAMASARPVVVTDGAGLDDYISNGRTGWLTPLGDASALGGRVLEVLANPSAGERMGHVARESVDSSFTSGHLARDLARFMQLDPEG